MGVKKDWAPIAVGEGDVELARELADKRRLGRQWLTLTACEPPLAQAVYVCGWCVRIIDRVDLCWEDERGVCVCACCADEFFTQQPAKA